MSDGAPGVEELYRRARERAAAPAGAAARLAVAVILWRRKGDHLEVYVGRRATTLAEAGGHWMFPQRCIEPPEHTAAAAETEDLQAAIRAAVLGLFDSDAPGPKRWALVSAGPVATLDSAARAVATRYVLLEWCSDAAPAVLEPLEELGWWAPADLLTRWRRGAMVMSAAVRAALLALQAGVEGATSRLAEALTRLATERWWDVAEAIAVCPLRTPTLPPATHTNAVLVGDAEVLVIDPGSPYQAERAALDAVLDALGPRRRVVGIWLTHHHGDHVGGARELAARLKVPIAAHRETARLLRGRVPIERHLDDGEVVELAGEPPRRLRCVYTPGHAPGHLCFLEEYTGIAIAGDMVASVGTIVIEPSEGDMTHYLASLRALAALSPTALIPAHGDVIADPLVKLELYLGHRLWREERVAEALRKSPATPRELVAVAYADVPAAVWPLAERSLIAHLIKLERDGRARREGEQWRDVP